MSSSEGTVDPNKASPASKDNPPNFIEELVAEDVKQAQLTRPLMTRFPPEPNGYLHIGHAKSICLNFGLAEKFNGICNLRFDDTNPSTESVEYVNSIQKDVRWLGFEFEGRLYHASNYFEKLYQFAVELIKKGKAYVDSSSLDEIRENRGNFYKPGKESPYRNRTVAENLDLFERMKGGEFKDGEHVLRAKIDMSSTNLNLRDPLMYRIRHVHHYRTGETWCIYPMYDYAHGLSDAIEGVTHSICTLEFENHRPLYEWFLAALEWENPPKQTEFARLNLSFTVLSKRKLQLLVKDQHVAGWTDPRMPTIAGLRRRGYTAEAIRRFCERIGVSKRDGVVDVALLEHALREDLNERSPRLMAVLRPLKVVIENYPEGEEEEFVAPFFPDQPEKGTRKLPFSRELYIEQDDFREIPAKKWFRLAPGAEVRLRYACLIKCTQVIKDDAGNVVELRCTWDPESRGGAPADGRKVKGTLHWVSAKHAISAEVRLYDRLFTKENPQEDDGNFLDFINPSSLETLSTCALEPSLQTREPGDVVQFERLGYFCADSEDSSPTKLVFNRTIGLRDSWANLEKKLGALPKHF
jgi:glutaminyl-tRNA synthetase